MLYTRNSPSGNSHDVVWELIPWYVNGSLPPEEKETVKRHVLTCPECAAEIVRQKAIAEQVATADLSEPQLSSSWSKLRLQIEADKHPERGLAKPQPDMRRRLNDFRGRFILTGAIAATFLAVAVFHGPLDSGFRTLTSSNSIAANTIKFQTIPGLDAKQLESLLARHGLKLVAGPSESGVYTASTTAGADLEATSAALMATPEIVFAAPDQQP